MPAHLKGQDREGQHQADPKAPGHVGELGVRPGFRRHVQRLKRHAADRATARPDLPDLRVHRAGVDRIRPCRRRHPIAEVAIRVGGELSPATSAAEIVGLSPELVPVRRLVRVHIHPAHRVLDGERRGGRSMVMLVTRSPFGMGGAAAAMAWVVHDRFPYVEARATTHRLDDLYLRGVRYKTCKRTRSEIAAIG